MIQGGNRVAGEAGIDRVLSATSYRLCYVRNEVMLGSPVLARLGLIALACALQTIVIYSPGHFRPAGSPFFAIFVPLGTIASLALSLAATLPVKRYFGLQTRRLLGTAALAVLAILTGVGILHGVSGIRGMAQHAPYTNDGAVMDLYAAKQVLHGHNPYLKTNIVTALAAIDAPSTTTTPLMDGQFRGARAYPSEAAIQQAFMNVLVHRPRTIPPEFESKYNYPAGSFLFILPFVWLGFHDMRFLYALAIVAIGVYLWTRMSPSLRFLVPCLLVSSVPLIVSSIGGQPDPLYGVFLMVGYAEWASPWLSPVSMGVAVATKQLAWFFLPFYLVLVAQKLGWREALRRCPLIGLVFLLLNGPFIVQSPSAYLASISGPMTDPMFPLGVGAIAMFVSGVLPLLPKVAFTYAELAAWAGSILVFARIRVLTPASGMVLGALPLFFAWRSLVNYFYLVPLLALAAALAMERGFSAQRSET